jgi:hypothetical protein
MWRIGRVEKKEMKQDGSRADLADRHQWLYAVA